MAGGGGIYGISYEKSHKPWFGSSNKLSNPSELSLNHWQRATLASRNGALNTPILTSFKGLFASRRSSSDNWLMSGGCAKRSLKDDTVSTSSSVERADGWYTMMGDQWECVCIGLLCSTKHGPQLSGPQLSMGQIRQKTK